MAVDAVSPAGVSFQRAVHLVSFVAFDFDLNRRVIDAEMPAQFVDDRLENLLPFANHLLGDKEVATASEDSGPTVQT